MIENVSCFGDCVVLRATNKALLARIPDLGENVWVPLSVIDDASEVCEAGDEGDLVVAEWWARKQGLV
jgi:hypothetical protein